jgi:hypothetical protein
MLMGATDFRPKMQARMKINELTEVPIMMMACKTDGLLQSLDGGE